MSICSFTNVLVIDQFLHSNLNTRTDEYGGSPEARCKFPLDLLAAVTSAIGPSNVAIRLDPACLYQGTYGVERVETWTHLCSQIAAQYSGSSEKLSYVHFIEPRQDRIDENSEAFYKCWTLPKVSNETFRAIIKSASIPCISCGGWDGSNAVSGIEAGWDSIALARWFVSNPDLPERFRLGCELQKFDRSRFYGSWDGVREHGYTDYPMLSETGK